jgi:hypothetical protein
MMSGNFDEGFFDEEPPVPPYGKEKKVTNLQLDDVLGFIRLLQGAATEYSAKLTAKQYTQGTAVSTQMDTDADNASKAHATAKSSDDATKALYAAADEKKQKLYTAGSNWCDQMASALGKETADGKAILAIRANLQGRGPNKPKTPGTP